MANQDGMRAGEAVMARARHIRHGGYVFFGGLVLWLVISLIGSVGPALSTGEARDPFTNLTFSSVQEACGAWERELNLRHEEAPLSQVQRRAWQRRCERVR